MKRLIKQIPNTITLFNLLFGIISIILAFNGLLRESAIFILLAFHADIFDGLFARLLRVESPIGKELDSLADLVSFGLAPAVVLHRMVMDQLSLEQLAFQLPLIDLVFLLSPFLLPLFAAIRLARFNVDEEQKNVFIGLPTPANALMILALPLIAYRQPDSFILNCFSEPYCIGIYALTVSLAMVAPIRLYSLKLKGFRIKVNLYRYLFGITGLIIILLFRHTGLFLTIPYYFLAGIALGQLQRKGFID